MAVQVGHPAQELQDDHRQARDGILDLMGACQERNARRAREIVQFLDMVAGPHWRWEEEGLYPAVRELSEELYQSLLKEHDEVIAAVRRLKEIFPGKRLFRPKSVSDGEWEEARKRTLPILYHIATCDGLPIMIEKLSENHLFSIRQAIFVSRRANVPLLEWAQRLRRREEEAPTAKAAPEG